MAFKLRRGLESERTTITPLEGEPLYTTDTHLLYIGDGSTAGGNLVGGASYFSAMTDVDVAGVPDGYFLIYSAASGEWVATGTTGVGGITELSGLTDVDTSTAINGQVLTYVSASDTWSAITSPVGITDHGLLNGLGDDDHTQYHNDSRAEIWLTGNNHDVISATTMTATTYNAGAIKFDTSISLVNEEGRMAWDPDSGTIAIGMPGGNVSLEVGQEFIVRVYNDSGVDIPNGSVVYNTGVHANRPTIALASAAYGQPATQYGMATEEILNGHYGYVTLIGGVNDIDTSAWTAGTPLYLSTTAGTLTNEEQSAPNLNAWMGVVVRQHANAGSIYFKPERSLTSHNLSDFNGTTPDATSKYLVWDNVNNYWDAGQIYFSGVSNTGHTHTESDITDLGDYALNESFTAHTAQTGIHFTEASINHTNIQNVGVNTHSQIDTFITSAESHIDDLSIHFDMDDVETQITGTTHDVLSSATITATTYQGIDFSMVANTSHTHDFSVITNTGHTHTESDITDLGDYTERTYFESHTGDSTIHFTEASINHTNIQNVGTNTHAQIDTHISNTNIHFSLNDVETQITGTTHDQLVAGSITATTITATTYQGIDSSMVANTGHTHDEYLVWDSKSVTFRETRADEDSTLFIVTDEIYIESAMTIMVGTTPTVDWRVMTGTSRTSGTEVFSGQSTGYTTIDYFSGDTTLSTIGTIVWLETTATGGTTVDEFHITIKYSGA